MLHLHEPLAPGPTMTALMCTRRRRSAPSTPPGESARYRLRSAARFSWLAGRLDHPRGGVARTPASWPSATSAAPTRSLFNGVELDALPGRATRRARDRAHDLLLSAATSRARASTCCSTPCAELPADVRLWVGGDGPETAALQRRATPATPGSSGSAGSATPRRSPACAAPTCSARPRCGGESFGVVLIEAMAAGTPSWPATSTATATWPADGVDALLVPPGDAAALATALRRVLGDAEPPAGSWPPGAVAGRAILDATLAERLRRRSTQALARRQPPRTPRAAHALGCPELPAWRATVRWRRHGSWLIILVIVARPGGARRRSFALQRPDPHAQPDRERLVADRRAAQAPARPHPEPRRDRQGLRRPRARDARRRHPGPQRGHRAHQAPAATRPRPTTMLTGALRQLFALARPTPTSRPTRTSSPCRRS